MVKQGLYDITGRPNGGKGSLTGKLREQYKQLEITLYSVGDRLREEVANGTELGKKAKMYMDAGALVPDELIATMVEKDMAKLSGIVFRDGFPRNKAQVDLCKEKGLIPNAIIMIDISREEALERSAKRRVCPECGATYTVEGGYKPPKKRAGHCDKCGTELIIRKDDKSEVSTKRQDVYDNETQPAIWYAIDKFASHGTKSCIIDNSAPGGYERMVAFLRSIGFFDMEA